MILILAIFTFVNLLYWVLIFTGLSTYKNNHGNTKNKISQTSILIAIKNEEKNIDKNFLSFLKQKPSGYEMLVIDDYSTDNSLKTLTNLAKINQNIKIHKNTLQPGKKYALTDGINNTDKELLVFTDADCQIKSEHWLKKMVSKFDSDTQIILGYSPYLGKGFLNYFIRFETFMTALQYFSYSIIGLPYMGVGRNMAIRKSFFLKNNGYKSHLDIKSGNDDLFVNANSNKNNTAIQIDSDTFVYSTPPKSLSAFINQKTRHVSTSFRYKAIHKFLLGVYSFSHIGFYVLLIIGIFILPIKTILLFWIIRLIIMYISTFNSFIKLKEEKLLLYLPILDFLMFVYYFFMGFYYFFAPKNKW